MIRIYHWDYDPMPSEPYREDIQEVLEKDSRVQYEFEEGAIAASEAFGIERPSIEEKIASGIDILMIHPGVLGGKVVIGEYPGKFPDTCLILLSPSPAAYRNFNGVHYFGYQQTDSIINFLRNEIDRRESQ